MKKLLFVSIIFTPALCLALPDQSAFKVIKANRTTKIDGCSVSGIDGAVTLGFTLESKVPKVALPKDQKKQAQEIGKKGNKFVACGTSDVDAAKRVVFLKNNKADTSATEHELSLSAFEDLGDVGSACSSVKPWPRNFIYKTVGSHHFTDIRRNTVGLIMTHGANVATPGCLDILSSNGEKISDFGLYARGAGWFARYYGGIGCGDTINGAALGARARSSAGDNQIYVRIGSTCYGPIDATKCIGSKAC